MKNVQRWATKLLPFLRTKLYQERLKDLWLPSLQYRRLHFDIIQVYRILNNIDHCNQNQLFTRDTNTRTRGHSQKRYKKNFRSDIRRFSFSQLHTCINQWNNLPNIVVPSESLKQFTSRLNKHWKTLQIKFQPDCYIIFHTRTSINTNEEYQNGSQSKAPNSNLDDK